jgi:two-component system, chemotaxis family, sensor kinase CheA
MELKVFDSLLEPTFLINQKTEIVYLNEAGAQLVGIAQRKLMRQKPLLETIFQFSVPLKSLCSLNQLTEASSYEEVQFESSEGNKGRIQITFQPYSWKGVDSSSESFFLVFMRDVTLEETLQRKYRKELEQKEGYIQDLEQARLDLQDYSKNLEVKVEERTQELGLANRTMKALLDSLGQGFFIFNEEGLILDIVTKSCEMILEKDPRGQKVWSVLNLLEVEEKNFKKWIQTIFAEMLPFEDLAPLGPNSYSHSLGHNIELSYYPLRDLDESIIGVVVVATDITDLVKAQKEALKERAHAQLILKLMHNKKQFGMFYSEAHEWLHRIKKDLNSFEEKSEELFRALHSLKGGAASFSLLDVAEACHGAETVLSDHKLPWDDKKQSLFSMVEKIELAFFQFQEEFETLLGQPSQDLGPKKEISENKIIQFGQRFLNHNPQLQHHFYFDFLFESIGTFLESLNDPWAEIAGQLGKQVDPIHIVNYHCSFWPRPYTSLLNSLIHIIRNAIDHGIEKPEERLSRGKLAQGHFLIEVKADSRHLILTLSDDGGGIATEKLKEKLKAKMTQSLLDSWSDFDIHQAIFLPDLSAKDEVTEVSGRGVGLDAVLEEAKKLGGRAWVESVRFQGTTIHIEVPFITPS